MTGSLPQESQSPVTPPLAGWFTTTSTTWEAPLRVCSVLCLVAQLFLTLCDPSDCNPPASMSMGILQEGILEWVAMPSSRGSSDPGIELGSPALQMDSLLAELSGKPNPIYKILFYINF